MKAVICLHTIHIRFKSKSNFSLVLETHSTFNVQHIVSWIPNIKALSVPNNTNDFSSSFFFILEKVFWSIIAGLYWGILALTMKGHHGIDILTNESSIRSCCSWILKFYFYFSLFFLFGCQFIWVVCALLTTPCAWLPNCVNHRIRRAPNHFVEMISSLFIYEYTLYALRYLNIRKNRRIERKRLERALCMRGNFSWCLRAKFIKDHYFKWVSI